VTLQAFVSSSSNPPTSPPTINETTLAVPTPIMPIKELTLYGCYLFMGGLRPLFRTMVSFRSVLYAGFLSPPLSYVSCVVVQYTFK